MKSKKAKRMARRIVRHLFTNGSGEKAQRLVMEQADGGNGGGWCEGAVRDRIEKILLGRKP